MSSDENVYRESQERLHKTLGAFLLIIAWHSKVDCLVLQRETLLNFLNLERMRNVRLDWLKEDLVNYFPYQWTTYFSRSKSYSTLYLSRFEIPKKPKEKTMSDEHRIKIMKQHGLVSQIYEIPDLKEIVSKMALFSNGLVTPTDFDSIVIFDLT